MDEHPDLITDLSRPLCPICGAYWACDCKQRATASTDLSAPARQFGGNPIADAYSDAQKLIDGKVLDQ